MMVLTPIRIELRLRTCGYFFEFTLFKLSLNILAFSRSGFSPVSWQREKKMSVIMEVVTCMEIEFEDGGDD
jgi:hypothetical protein